MTMSATMSAPVRRMVVLSLPVFMATFFWTFIIAPSLGDIASNRENVSRSLYELRRYYNLTAELPALHRQLRQLDGESASDAYLTPASSALMAAIMQAKVQDVLSSSSAVTLRSSRTLPSSSEKGFERVAVEVALSASSVDLRKILYSVTVSKPDIIVERLAVQVPETETLASDTDSQPKFEVMLTLASYAKQAERTAAQ